MLQVGIIGMGKMGRTHFEAYDLLPNVRVRAICDHNPQRARGNLVGTEGNILGAGIQQLDMTGILDTTDHQVILNHPEINIIDICTATPQHLELAMAALATGKHVICEKPLARTSADARKIAAAAHQASGLFMTAMCLRFWPEWAWLKTAISEQRYGRLLGLTIRRVASMPQGWYSNGELSGGALLDLHIHDTDFVDYLLGKPAAVFSRGYSKTSGAVDHLMTQYLFDGPAAPSLVTAEGSWCLADGCGFQMKYTANCERATLDYDLGRTPMLTVTAAGQVETIKLPNETGYFRELQYFVECVERGEQPCVVKIDDPVRCLEILEAEERSVISGKIERLS